MPLFQKLETIAKRIYHADEVIADKSIRDQLKTWEAAGYGHLPICVAKTQYLHHRSDGARCAHGAFGAGAGSAPLGRGRVHRRDLR
jgi:formyltetrahydrofolate synthetase